MISPSPTHDHDKEHTLSRRSFLRLGGTALLLATGGCAIPLPGPSGMRPAFAATVNTIPKAYAQRMPSDLALMKVNKNTLVKATWKGVTGKVIPSPTQPSVNMYLINKGSSASSHTFTNFLTMNFEGIGSIGGKALNARIVFTKMEIGAHVGKTYTGEDTSGNTTCVALVGPNLIAIGASYISGDPTYGYGFRGPRTTQVSIEVTWADSGNAVGLPFFAAISDIDAPSSTGATWYTEGWSADSGFTDQFWTWPSSYLVVSGNRFSSPKTDLTSGDDRWFKAGVIAPLSGNAMISSFIGGGCTTNLTLYSSYAGLQPPVKSVAQERTYVAGETLEYTVTQKMGCFFEDTMNSYASLVMEDVLPAGLTYESAALSDSKGTNLLEQGTLTYAKATRTLRFSFSSDWLGQVSNYAGQDLILTIRCTVDAPEKLQATLKNKATTYFSGFGYDSNEVTVRVIQPCSVTVTKRILTQDVNWAHGQPTFVFTLAGVDHGGTERTYATTIAFSQDDDQSGEWMSRSAVINTEPGTYVLSEEPCLRYEVDKVESNGTVKSKTAELDLLELVHGTATFTNRKTGHAGLSDVVSVRNHIGPGQ